MDSIKILFSKLQSSISKLSDENQLPKIARFVVIAFAVVCFFVFYQIHIHRAAAIEKNIVTILRSESRLSNSYALSKALVDLESIQMFSCSILTEQNSSSESRVFYNSYAENGCSSDSFIAYFLQQEVSLVGLNGHTYILTYFSDIDFILLFSELVIFFFIVILGIILPRYFEKALEAKNARLRHMELQKNSMLELSQQVAHDVASPLSALNTISDILQDINPEVKSVLAESVRRTNAIFQELRRGSAGPKLIDLRKCIQVIISEKKLFWKDTVEFKVDIDNAAFIKIAAEEVILSSVISNILNNAYDAMLGISRRTIYITAKSEAESLQLKIRDTGKGIPKEVLPLLGTKGFTWGKTGLPNSGKGLGLYQAFKSLNQWGASITIESLEGHGTEVNIVFSSKL